MTHLIENKNSEAWHKIFSYISILGDIHHVLHYFIDISIENKTKGLQLRTVSDFSISTLIIQKGYTPNERFKALISAEILTE